MQEVYSICANIAEGRGRYNYQDNKRFIKIARGSLYETISLDNVGFHFVQPNLHKFSFLALTFK